LTDTSDTDVPQTAPSTESMAWVPATTFRMGSDVHYREEAPAHRVAVSGFWIDRYQVTNEDYARFVEHTDYVTVAERPLTPAEFPDAPPENLVPGSLVFTRTDGPVDLRHLNLWWRWTPGACWRHPDGPRSGLDGRESNPVVHVAYEDAVAYARWAGKDLPTEAEWECAARGGLEGAEYAWGDQQLPDREYPGNWWQGRFPCENVAADGYEDLAPVGAFRPNRFGLHEMTGNAWEWTSDWYTSRHPADPDKPCCVPQDPRGGAVESSYDRRQPQFRVPRRVIKGGSYLCADSYCKRYRPAARRPQMIDTGMSHIGFRCVARAAGPAD
jgi:formylglycine-generating enzyme required for sulfatase activity